MKKKLSLTLGSALLITSLYAQTSSIQDILSKSFSKPSTFRIFRKLYNSHYKITKPEKIDSITWINENIMKGKTIYLTKELKGSKKDVNKLYNSTLKYFGPKNKIKQIIFYLGKSLNYNAAKAFCEIFKNTDYFQNGGKVKITVIDDFNHNTNAVTIDSEKKCNQIYKEDTKYSDILKQMVLKNRKK